MSCLFNSLDKCLKRLPSEVLFKDDDSSKIRHRICDYLETNPVLFDDIKTEEIIQWDIPTYILSTYVNRMRSTSTWGGAIEIRAFVKLYEVDVEVINIRDFTSKSNIEFVNEYNKYKVKITWNGYHYEPILKD